MKRFLSILLILALVGCNGPAKSIRLDGSLSRTSPVSIPEAPRKATPDEVRAYMVKVFDDVDRVWKAFFASENLDEPTVASVIIEAGPGFQSLCSFDPVLTDTPNAFYCYLDANGEGAIILPLATFVDLFSGSAFGRIPKVAGDFAAAIVIAHEIGHSITDELSRQLDLIFPYDPDGENLADCFAGNWARSADSSGILKDERDFAEAVALMEAVGDTPGPGQTHGTAQQRAAALNKGYFTGRPIDCIREYWPMSGL